MKIVFVLIATLVLPGCLTAQNRLSVTSSKVIHLICPDRVSYLQVGDPTLILADVPEERPNLVRLKAKTKFEDESSLTVISAGQIYSLILDYKDSNRITYQITDFSSEKSGTYQGGVLPNYVLKSLSDLVLEKPRRWSTVRKTEKEGILLALRAIYLKSDVLFFDLEITNKTNLSYEVESLHWWIDDRKQRKATNVQEYQVFPVYQRYDVKVVPPKTSIREVIVLPKLTIPDQRELRLELLEKALGNTGRQLSLKMKNKDILKAKSLKGY